MFFTIVLPAELVSIQLCDDARLNVPAAVNYFEASFEGLLPYLSQQTEVPFESKFLAM